MLPFEQQSRRSDARSICSASLKSLCPSAVACCYRDNTVSSYAGLLPLDNHTYDLTLTVAAKAT
jgi:hypothetical protein